MKTAIAMSTGSGRSGFTLIEVLVAGVILAIGLVAIASAIHFSYRMQVVGKMKTRIAVLGQAKMEEILDRPFTDFVQGTQLTPANDTTLRAMIQNTEDTAEYAAPFTFTITTTNIGAGKMLRRVDLNIRKEDGEFPQSETFTTIIVNKEGLTP